jgi:chromosome segregation ATPase
MTDDDDDNPSPTCLMAKDKKVKSKSTILSLPHNVSSSDLSDSSSDDDVSSDEEIDNITKNLDPKTKLFITKLLEELDGVHAELDARDNDLDTQEKIYVSCKEALAVERSEVADLKKSLSKEKENHALTKKENIALLEKYCALDKKHKERSCNMTFFERATHSSLVQRISLTSLVLKVVENAIILI